METGAIMPLGERKMPSRLPLAAALPELAREPTIATGKVPIGNGP
jgi:hypothetical protein